MNFLDLCRRAREEVGYSGNGPASVQGQVGEMGRLVNKVNSAWLEIQQCRQDWRFMRGSFNVSISAGATEVTIAGLKEIDADSIMLIDGGASYQMHALTRDLMRNLGAHVGRPTHCYSERGKIVLWPASDGAYTITGDYYRQPTLMALENSAIPDMPEEYHLAIVWLAVKQLGAFEEAGNTYAHAAAEYRAMLDRMLQSETPSISFGGSIA